MWCNTLTGSDGRPNILILLADDLGYGELGCYGQQRIKTPVIDNLARSGVRFTNFYAGNAVCSPSRAVLLTGISSSHSSIRGNSGYYNDDRWMRVSLKKEETTLGELLQNAGYQTAFVGKWHLDDPNDVSTWAFNRGFDFAVQEQWGSRFGGTDYDTDMHWINGKKDSIYYNWKEWDCKDDFRTDIALNYLDTLDTCKPFFLFMSYRAPHGHEREIGNQQLYRDQGWPDHERLHAAKITLLDRQIGKLLNKLEEMGLLENTLVLFTSDNGPHSEGRHHDPEFFNSNGDLRGIKRDLYEGGIRVPLIVNWKGKIASGDVSEHLSGFQDLMPTLADIAGTAIPDQSNGISLLPVFKGEKPATRDYLTWEFQLDGWFRKMPDGGFRQSVRLGKWKAIRYGINSQTELYNLESDISESTNVATEHPELIQKVDSLFKSSRTQTFGFPYGGVFQQHIPRDIFKAEHN